MGRPKKEAPNRADRLYEVKCTIGKTFDGKLIRKSFYSSISKEDARRSAEEYRIAQAVAEQTGEPMPLSKDTTFGQWAARWLETYKKGVVKENTYYSTYVTNLEHYLLPYFGKHPLQGIKPADVQEYFNNVRKATDPTQLLCKNTLHKHLVILKSIFNSAIENDLCYKNPALHIKFPTVKPAFDKRVYNESEKNTVEEYVKPITGGEGIVIMLNTGIRRGELCGLMWEDIDFDTHTIHVQRSISCAKSGLIVGAPKTSSSDRYIPVTTHFIGWLLTLERKSVFVIPKFDGSNGPCNPNTYSAMHNRIMKNVHAATGLFALTAHELRHTYGTILREKGVDIYSIQKVMGHADVGITSKVYIHNDLDVLRQNLGIESTSLKNTVQVS